MLNLPFDIPDWDIGLNHLERKQVIEYLQYDIQINRTYYENEAHGDRYIDPALTAMEYFLLLTSSLRILEIVSFFADKRGFKQFSFLKNNPLLVSHAHALRTNQIATYVTMADLHYYGVLTTNTYPDASIRHSYERYKEQWHYLRHNYINYDYERNYRKALLPYLLTAERLRVSYWQDHWLKEKIKVWHYYRSFHRLIKNMNKKMLYLNNQFSPINDDIQISFEFEGEWISLRWDDLINDLHRWDSSLFSYHYWKALSYYSWTQENLRLYPYKSRVGQDKYVAYNNQNTQYLTKEGSHEQKRD